MSSSRRSNAATVSKSTAQADERGAARCLRLDEAAAAPPLGRARHVDVEDVGHLAPVVRDEPEIGEPRLAALGDLGRDGDGHEAAVRGHAVGQASPAAGIARPRGRRPGRRRRLRRHDDHAGDEAADEAARRAGRRRFGAAHRGVMAASCRRSAGRAARPGSARCPARGTTAPGRCPPAPTDRTGTPCPPSPSGRSARRRAGP